MVVITSVLMSNLSLSLESGWENCVCAFVCDLCSILVLFITGRVAMEGKVEHKFDMKPHEENLEEYGRLCRERTNKSMIKNRQIQVGQLVYIALAKVYLFKCYMMPNILFMCP